MVLHDWRQLERVAHEDELATAEESAEARRLQHLRRLVDDTDVKDTLREHHVIRTQARRRHDALETQTNTNMNF